MAARTKKPIDTEEDDVYEDDDLDTVDPIAEMADESFERVLTELSGGDIADSRIHLYRDIKGKSVGAELFSMSPEEFDMAAICDRLREDYNGGDFRAVLKRKGRIFKSTPIIVEVPKNRTNPVPVVNKESDDKFIAMMNMQMEQMRIAADEARRESREAQKTMQTMMLEVIRAGSQRPEQSSTSELMNLLIMSKNLNGGGGSGDAVDSLLKGIELGKELAGGSDDGPLMGALKTIAPVIQQGMAAQQVAVRAAPVKKPALPAKPAPAPVTPAPDDAQLEFVALAKMIKRAADKGSDPDLYADFLLDQMGEEALLPVFNDELQYQAFLGMVPGGVSPDQKSWLDRVRESVLTYLHSEADTFDDGETIPDDAGDGDSFESP